MKKKFVELSAQELQIRMKEKSIRHRKVKDKDIDYTDAPTATKDELKKFKRVGRPLLGQTPRIPIHIRVDEDVLTKIKKEAKRKGVGYQSLINELLKKAV